MHTLEQPFDMILRSSIPVPSRGHLYDQICSSFHAMNGTTTLYARNQQRCSYHSFRSLSSSLQDRLRTDAEIRELRAWSAPYTHASTPRTALSSPMLTSWVTGPALSSALSESVGIDIRTGPTGVLRTSTIRQERRILPSTYAVFDRAPHAKVK